MWTFLLILLVWFFTTALVHRHKERALEARELRITDKNTYDEELATLLLEVVILETENKELKARHGGF